MCVCFPQRLQRVSAENLTDWKSGRLKDLSLVEQEVANRPAVSMVRTCPSVSKSLRQHWQYLTREEHDE